MKLTFFGLIRLSLPIVLLSMVSIQVNADEVTQEQLDADCEAARQEKLAEVKAEYIEECIEKKQRPDREACERFYADYGESSGGNQVPLFYDLPECVKATDNSRSPRATGR